MRYTIQLTWAALAVLAGASEAPARGFGGFRAGGMAVGPAGGVRAGAARGGAYVGPFSAGAGGARAGTYVGPRGATVQAGRAGGIERGPLGGVHAAGAEGVRVTTPGGRTFAEGRAGGAGVGPLGGVHAHGAAGAAASGPFGAAAAGRAGGVAVGPFGGVAAGGAYRGGVAVRGGGVAVAHSTRFISGATLHTGVAPVRAGYGGFGYRYFTPGWYGVHTTAWTTTRWRTANFWAAPAWPVVTAWVGVVSPPLYYDYGSTVVIESNNVYVNGEPAGTAEQYAEQATAIADKGRAAKPADADEWQPLGVFGLIQGDGEKVAQNIFQLAVNKAGVVRGNYYDAVADNTLQVFGSLDPKTQKVAWSVGEKKAVVYEAGLNNLTRDETTVLVHYGKERTQQMVLVRLEQGKDATK